MSAEAQAVSRADAALAFSDATTFREWLERLPHGNLVQCHAQFAAQARLLSSLPLRPAARLDLLELMRETIADVQQRYGEICWGRPVPLDAGDQLTWQHVVNVWRDLAAAYDALILDLANSADEIAGRAHVICQRALRYTGLAMSEHNRVYRSIGPELWRQLHRLYVFAETAGIATQGVHDPVGRADPSTSCAATYMHALLAQLAQPDAMSLHQMNLLDGWLDRWERLATLSPDPLPESAISALAVDLAGDKGVGFARDLPAAGVRHLRLEPLGKMLRDLVACLRQGQTPADLGLGPLPRVASEHFLLLLYIQWCAAGTGRMDRRVRTQRRVMIFPTIPSIHFHISSQASANDAATTQARATGGVKSVQPLWSEQAGTVETWLIVNQSASGVLGLCRDPEGGTGIAHAQLVGIRAPGDDHTHIGIVQRLIVDEDGAIWAGLRLLPGTPEAAAAKVVPTGNEQNAQTRQERALILSADTELKSPATIVLPPTWYRANRIIEVHTDTPQSVRLLALLERGTNFERATYMACAE